MRKRELAAKMLNNLFVRSFSPVSKGLRIVAYHRVLNTDSDAFAFDKGVLSAGVEDFYEQMKFARRNFNVTTFAELYQCELQNRLWPDRALIITFDDGYRDNYTNAFPVLKELGLPATIFLATSHIGQRKLFWWDAICYCAKHTPRETKVFKELPEEVLYFSTSQQRQVSIGKLLNWAKQVPDELRRAFVGDLPAALQVEMTDAIAEGMHLSWDDVREMSEKGIEFGSHTVTHPILANVSAEQLDWEMGASKKAIEQQTGKEVLALAYPAGQKGRFTQAAKDGAARQGYRYAVSYDEGIVLQRDFDRYEMPRIHVELELTSSLFRANLFFPELMLRSAGHAQPVKEISGIATQAKF